MHALLDTSTFLWLAFEPDDPFDRLIAAHAIESGST